MGLLAIPYQHNSRQGIQKKELSISSPPRSHALNTNCTCEDLNYHTAGGALVAPSTPIHTHHHTPTHQRTHTQTHTHTHPPPHTQTPTHPHTHTHTHTHKHTHTHTHT